MRRTLHEPVPSPDGNLRKYTLNDVRIGSHIRLGLGLSTTSPEMTASLVERTNLRWLDCPVSGGPIAAEAGKLTMMAGGDAALFARLRPVLDDLAGNLTLMGDSGSGQVTKIINQAIVGSTYLVVAEALAMARLSGDQSNQLFDQLAQWEQVLKDTSLARPAPPSP